MDHKQISAAITGLLGLGIGAISAYLTVKGKDGDGWAFIAALLILTSCSLA